MAVGRKKNRGPKKNPTGVYRLIGGQWRSRRLHFPEVEGLRPTTDRVRETVFNWLQYDLPGAQVLDVFAGSGALAFEALSRGAARATLLERDERACRFLQENASTLQAQSQVRIACADALNWLAEAQQERFDLVFLDPPFRQGLLKEAIAGLEAAGCCEEGARVYIENAIDDPPVDLPAHWRIDREKQAGQVRYAVLTVTGVSE